MPPVRCPILRRNASPFPCLRGNGREALPRPAPGRGRSPRQWHSPGRRRGGTSLAGRRRRDLGRACSWLGPGCTGTAPLTVKSALPGTRREWLAAAGVPDPAAGSRGAGAVGAEPAAEQPPSYQRKGDDGDDTPPAATAGWLTRPCRGTHPSLRARRRLSCFLAACAGQQRLLPWYALPVRPLRPQRRRDRSVPPPDRRRAENPDPGALNLDRDIPGGQSVPF